MEEFKKRSNQSDVNKSDGLKAPIRQVVSEERAADNQRSYLELPAPVLVGALLLGALLAKNDDDDLTLAGFAVLFFLYAFYVAAAYVSARRGGPASRSNESDGRADSPG